MAKSNRAKSLEAQADAVAKAVFQASNSGDRELLMEGHNSLKRAASRADHTSNKIAESPVLNLPSNATRVEVGTARRRHPVRLGPDVLLPFWSEAAVGLPNKLLRSSLWRVRRDSEALLEGELLAVMGDVSVLFTGKSLDVYDRRVYANCLEYYRGDRPLSPEDPAAWIRVSFHEFIQRMGIKYHVDTHTAVRDSLLRLDAASVQVRAKGRNLPVINLLSLRFADGYSELQREGLRSSDRMEFHVSQSVAELYDPNDWTAVPKAALREKGVQGFLAGFYATHSHPKWLPVETLKTLACASGSVAEFRRALKTALNKLKRNGDSAVQVAEYYFSKSKKFVWVCRTAWATGKSIAVPDEPSLSS